MLHKDEEEGRGKMGRKKRGSGRGKEGELVSTASQPPFLTPAYPPRMSSTY
jgi:hypothetical protein